MTTIERTGRWCVGPYEPDACKTCFVLVDTEHGPQFTHRPATGYYEEPADEYGHACRQGVCDSPDCRSRRYANEEQREIVQRSTPGRWYPIEVLIHRDGSRTDPNGEPV